MQMCGLGGLLRIPLIVSQRIVLPDFSMGIGIFTRAGAALGNVTPRILFWRAFANSFDRFAADSFT